MNFFVILSFIFLLNGIQCLSNENNIANAQDALSTNEIIDDIAAAKPTDVAAVGRAAQLGELYDARNDQFIRLELFNATLPPESIISTENWHTKLKLTLINSLEEKFNLMDISASLKVSVLGGMFSLEGSGRFFKDTKKSEKSAKATLIHSISTKYEQINMISSAIGSLIDLDALNNIECTHVVVGIQWGGNAFVSVEDTNQDFEDKQKIEGKLAAELEKLSLKISGSAQVDLTEEEKKKFSSFKLEIFGDVLPDKVPNDLVGALRFMQDVPKLIRDANEGRGKAMSYTLLPISLLRKRFGGASRLKSIVQDVNEATVKKAVKIFDELNNQQAKINDLMTGINKYEPYLPTEKVRGMQDIHFAFNILQSEVQKDLSQHLVAVRSNKEEIHELEEMLSNYTQRIEEYRVNKSSVYNELKPALRFVEFLQNQNVTMLRKSEMFRQFLREHFDQDIYILFYKLNDQSDESENVVNNFQKMLRKRDDFGKDALFVATSYELLNESKFPVVIDRDNKTVIRLYKNNALVSDNFVPGQNITNGTDPASWSLYQVQQILNASRTNLRELEKKHELLSKQTNVLEEETGNLTRNRVPVGFIYHHLPFQSEPVKIWPNCIWEDVTSQYAGKFFRAAGKSEPFGKEQGENSPRLTNVKFMDTDDAGNWEAKMIPGRWSDAVSSGNRDGSWVSMKFLVSDAEVRPQNYAIKIWKNKGCSDIHIKELTNNLIANSAGSPVGGPFPQPPAPYGSPYV